MRRIEVERAATQLLHEYAARLDGVGGGSVGALFTEDGVLELPDGVHQGRAGIEFVLAGAAAAAASTHHVVTNIRVVQVSGSRVWLVSSFLAILRRVGASGVAWGHYHDVVELDADRPLFVRKRIEPLVRTDLVRGWPADPGDLPDRHRHDEDEGRMHP
ncbi:nuclear transport factor 2 family protein [Nocardioides nanhaiensis]|uniref:nuclear transport factor 2 family protein n=1 Tax=Nocardioides nanhaiensis TaxID=1476871 RepID=UPI0031E4ED3C